MRPGHDHISGTRVPPSYSFPLPARNGALLVGGCVHAHLRQSANCGVSLFFFFSASSAVLLCVLPPLSELKMMIVLSASPCRSTASKMRPKHSSTLRSIEAMIG